MSNTYFNFKQFTVHQSQNSMKVCTDSCLFGAYIPIDENVKRVLDIGSGTGLLSMMLAQKSSAYIEGVEIDERAYLESCKNINASGFKDRIQIHHDTIQKFASGSILKYDVIISNPPFFANHLLSPKDKQNQAFHSNTLSLQKLVLCVAHLLQDSGVFWVLLPPFESKQMVDLMNRQNLYIKDRALVFNTPDGKEIRHIQSFSRNKGPMEERKINIKETDGQYSPYFRSLLKDYYLEF